MRLDINYKKKTVRNTDTWRLNNAFLNNQQVTEEIKREIKKFLETNDKGLISKIYKQLIQLNTRKAIQSKIVKKT